LQLYANVRSRKNTEENLLCQETKKKFLANTNYAAA